MHPERMKIQATLKSLMRQRDLTYHDLSQIIRVSAATIKRRLNNPDISLEQISEFAKALQVSFYDIVELSKHEMGLIHELTEAQEQLLASDLRHLMVLRFALMGRTFSEIQNSLRLKASEFRKILKKMEQVNILKLLVNDRIETQVKFPIKWKPNGSLSKSYESYITEIVCNRVRNKGNKAGLNRKFEIALPEKDYRNFCQEIEAVYLRYRNVSEATLTSRTNPENLVSGLLFIDRFSCWDQG